VKKKKGVHPTSRNRKRGKAKLLSNQAQWKSEKVASPFLSPLHTHTRAKYMTLLHIEGLPIIVIILQLQRM
jgi:hypothetical protein